MQSSTAWLLHDQDIPRPGIAPDGGAVHAKYVQECVFVLQAFDILRIGLHPPRSVVNVDASRHEWLSLLHLQLSFK